MYINRQLTAVWEMKNNWDDTQPTTVMKKIACNDIACLDCWTGVPLLCKIMMNMWRITHGVCD